MEDNAYSPSYMGTKLILAWNTMNAQHLIFIDHGVRQSWTETELLLNGEIAYLTVQVKT